jgi:hypothetical protein
VVAGIQTLSDPESEALGRMAGALHAVMRSSMLGFGLYSVDPRLWDDVLAWAAVNKRVNDATWLEEQVLEIDAYLLGATSFRYPSTLRNQFSRLAMTEALAAGLSEEAFPTERIAEVTRSRIPPVGDGRTRIRGTTDDEERLWVADANASLFLSVLQEIPYRPQRDVFDWDHIFPQGKASLMWSPGPGGRWRRHHPYRRFVGSAGNLWGLDTGTNRAAKDRLPAEKFHLVENPPPDSGRGVWPRNRWWLQEDEIKEFAEIGRFLDAGADIEGAVDRFHSLVRTRALRTTQEVFRRLPAAESFAGDRGMPGADPKPEPPIAKVLGIEIREEPEDVQVASTTDAPDERVERVLRLADQWGSGDAVRKFIACARRLGLQVRGYQWSLMITPPTTRALGLVTLAPDEKHRGQVTTWVAPWAFADHFPGIARERLDEELAGIRGALYDGRELDALGDRLERLLRGQPPVAPA